MASTTLRCCCLLMATIAMMAVNGISALGLSQIQPPPPPPPAPWTAPYNTFAHAPIHAHTWAPPIQQGATPPPRPTTTVLPLHPSPYPFFHTLPYPLPRPLLCPGFGYPPYAVDQHGRLPPTQAQALYQNNGRQPLPFFPMPYTIRCYPFPLPFPLPYTGVPPPQ